MQEFEAEFKSIDWFCLVSAAATLRRASASGLAYLSLILVEAWPIAFAITCSDTPSLASADPNVCLRSYHLSRRVIPASFFAITKYLSSVSKG